MEKGQLTQQISAGQLQRAADLNSQPPFALLTSNIVSQARTTSFTHTIATGPGSFFYRVGVQ